MPVESSYALTGGGGYGFALGSYNRQRPLVIDPGLAYSTYLGGAGSEAATAVEVDGDGNAFVTGATTSTDFPTTTGAFDVARDGTSDAFVTKLDASGSTPLYSTYLGGAADDSGSDVAVDGAGAAYVTGRTSSADFPTTPGAPDPTVAGSEAFAVKLAPSGSALDYSTYLGGSGFDAGEEIALGSDDQAFVTGITSSSTFPVTPGAFQPGLSGSGDLFVTKLNAAGSAFTYSTYLGGSADELLASIAVDSGGNAYLAGGTISSNFPVTPGAFDTVKNGFGVELPHQAEPDGLGARLLDLCRRRRRCGGLRGGRGRDQCLRGRFRRDRLSDYAGSEQHHLGWGIRHQVQHERVGPGLLHVPRKRELVRPEPRRGRRRRRLDHRNHGLGGIPHDSGRARHHPERHQ